MHETQQAAAALLALTTVPDVAAADALTAAILDAHAAACVTRLAPAQSSYHWQGKRETAEEIPLLIKTTPAAYARLQAVVERHHPYDTPELIALPVTAGLPAYLAWVAAETKEAGHA
ncbi:MAG: divalent-cation tolerance protein CutA [Candidatus Protistobacter heckmanni]|nr:divalent-cation tolerance protein CutA [Candidatus Protistobacter heckmanni]